MAVSPGGFVALDCADPTELGEFWANMLDGEAIAVNADVVAVRTPWVWLTALRVDSHTPPTWPSDEVPKQMHLDLAVVDLDVAVAEHPFCLTNQIPLDAIQGGDSAPQQRPRTTTRRATTRVTERRLHRTCHTVSYRRVDGSGSWREAQLRDTPPPGDSGRSCDRLARQIRVRPLARR